MNERKLRETAQRHKPTQSAGKHACIAFISGGTFAVAAQILMEAYRVLLDVSKDTAVSMTVVTIIFTTATLTGLGWYDKAAQVCGAGLFIPISGFANSLTSCAIEGKSEGFIYGIGSNMFKLAGSVLTYGIAAAFVFGTLRYLLFGG